MYILFYHEIRVIERPLRANVLLVIKYKNKDRKECHELITTEE